MATGCPALVLMKAALRVRATHIKTHILNQLMVLVVAYDFYWFRLPAPLRHTGARPLYCNWLPIFTLPSFLPSSFPSFLPSFLPFPCAIAQLRKACHPPPFPCRAGAPARARCPPPARAAGPRQSSASGGCEAAGMRGLR